jgi:Flp pilus assembly protein TadB
MAQRDAVRITTAPPSRSEELAKRQRRYIISMVVRLLCFVLAYAVGPGWLRWVFVAGAVFLPYFAVVFANAEDRRNEHFRLDASGSHRALGQGTHEALTSGEDQ